MAALTEHRFPKPVYAGVDLLNMPGEHARSIVTWHLHPDLESCKELLWGDTLLDR